MRHLFTNTDFDFIGVRKYAYTFTALFFIPGLILLLVRGLNYSIEFTGGTLVQFSTSKTVDVASLRQSLDQGGVTGAEIVSFGGPGEFLIRARLHQGDGQAENTEATATAVRGALDQAPGSGQYTVVRAENVGPKVGGEL